MSKIMLDYNEITDYYIAMENDILSEESYVLEAENIDPSVNKEKIAKRVQDTVLKLMDKLVGMIDAMILKLKNRFRQVLVTDKGFDKILAKAERDRKPKNAIKIINYQYTPEFLSSQYGKLHKVISDLMNEVSSANIKDDSILLYSAVNLEKSILESIGFRDGNFQDYLKYVRKEFRGEKKEQTILKTQLPKHKKDIALHQSANGVLNRDLVDAKSKVNNLRGKTRTLIRSEAIADTKKQKYSTQFRNISSAYNMYSSFTSMYYELLIELMLSSRIIIKRFYQL